MNALPAFFLGMLVGWIVEWVIDWIYWRRRTGETQNQNSQLRDQLAKAEARNAELERKLALTQQPLPVGTQDRLTNVEIGGMAAAGQVETQNQISQLRDQLAKAEARNAELESKLALTQQPLPAGTQDRLTNVEIGGMAAAGQVETISTEPDDLIIIKGIGPVIAGKLNQAGIFSFDQLSKLTPDRLRELVGNTISQLADEEDLIAQAKQLAEQKKRGKA